MVTFPKTIRVLAICIIALAAMVLGLGAVLYRAAFTSGADSNYVMAVTWWSVFRSVLWPPANFPFLALVGVACLTAFTGFVFFRTPRGPSTLILFLESAVAYFAGGGFGIFFLRREFDTYHFTMDAERLGEYWFTSEAVAIWSAAAFLLAILRITARTNREAEKSQVGPQMAIR
jgi:hypothetical protein